MPPASRPMASIFWLWRERSSCSRRRVTSRFAATKFVIVPSGPNTAVIVMFSV